MPDQPEKQHHHAGKTSEKYLRAEPVIAGTGLKVGDTFLDIGCGIGFFSLEASRVVGNSGRVYAFDNYGESISALKERIAHEGITNIEAATVDVTEKLPLDTGIIDVCLMADVLHGFLANREIEGVMREIARVMKKAGALTVVEFKKVDGPPGPPLSIRLSPEELENIVSPYGFEKMTILDIGPHHYEVILRRT